MDKFGNAYSPESFPADSLTVDQVSQLKDLLAIIDRIKQSPFDPDMQRPLDRIIMAVGRDKKPGPHENENVLYGKLREATGKTDK